MNLTILILATLGLAFSIYAMVFPDCPHLRRKNRRAR